MIEENEYKKDIGKTLISYLPLLTVVVIIIGLFVEIVYYAYFNLQIKYFINISEIGIIISDNLAFIVPIFIFGMLVLSNKDNSIISTSDSERKEIIPIFLAILCGLIFGSFNVKYSYLSFLVLLAFIIPFILLFICFIFKKKLVMFFFPPYRTTILMSCLFTLTMMMLYCVVLINKTQQGNYLGTIIQTKDSTYISTPSNYYIGKTEKFLFIHNVKDSTNTIIPTESVIKIILKSRFVF